MSTIVTRAGKGSPLTHNEVDANFNNLNNDKYQSGSSPSFAGTTLSSGNLTFSGTGQRITGDMSNATQNNRLLFQTSTTNGFTTVGFAPNGTGTGSASRWYSSSDVDNASVATIIGGGGTASMSLQSTITGTGTYLPMTFYTGGSERMRLTTAGDLGLGTTSPGARLEVSSASNQSALFKTSATGSYGAVQIFNTNTNGEASIGFRDNSDSDATSWVVGKSVGATDALGFYYGSTRMVIDTSGNVGIGTASPSSFESANGSSNLVVGSGSGAEGITIYSGNAANNYGAINFADGTTGDATYRGIVGYRQDIDAMLLYTAATERMRIDNNGNVGIGGTANAFSKLNITGTLASSGANSLPMYIDGTIPSTTTSQAQIFRSNVTTQATSFTLNTLAHFMAGAGSGFGAGSTVTTHVGFWANSDMIGGTNNYGFRSSIASGANRWNVYSDGTANNYFAGNISIGTTTPPGTPSASILNGYEYHHNSPGRYIRWNTYFDGSTVKYYGNGTAGVFGMGNGGEFEFYTYPSNSSGAGAAATGTLRLHINNNGNVGIGTASPSFKFEVQQGSASASPSLRQTPQVVLKGYAGGNTYHSGIGFSMYEHTNGYWGSGILEVDDTNNYGAAMAFYTSNGSATPTPSERMRIASGGEVYIAGTTDQGAYNLQVNGTGVWGAGAYVNGSDARLKNNIQSLDSGLDVVKAMRPVTFQYKPEYSKDQNVQPGFIAQELQEAMAGKPYLEGVVQEGTNHLNVAYQNIIPILVKAIQELEAKVAALEAK